MTTHEIERKLRRLQLLTTLIVAFSLACTSLAAAGAIYLTTRLQTQTNDLEILTQDLCATLERAGITISGSVSNPCAR